MTPAILLASITFFLSPKEVLRKVYDYPYDVDCDSEGYFIMEVDHKQLDFQDVSQACWQGPSRRHRAMVKFANILGV